MRGALLSTAVVALSLGLVRGGASGDASGNISARLRATGHAEDNPGLRKLQDEFVKEQHQHEARFGRRVSAEEIKALVAHRLEAHPGKSGVSSQGWEKCRPWRTESVRISYFSPGYTKHRG